MSTEMHHDRLPTHLVPIVAESRAVRARPWLFHGLVLATVLAFAVFADSSSPGADSGTPAGREIERAELQAGAIPGLAPCGNERSTP